MKKYILAAIAVVASFVFTNAQFVITPKSGDPVNVNGIVSFSANVDKTSWSVGDTYTSDMDLSKIESISLATPVNNPKVGDFFYSDGSWSTELDASKTPIGVVFYVGDPGVDDAALRADFPGCTHGLVVGLKQAKCEWQDAYSDFGDDYEMTVGEWIEENSDYVSITTRSEAMTSVFNKIMGYNNTKGIDVYNDEFGWDYEVLVGANVSSVMSLTPAPSNTSGWYVPSVKEVSLLCSGDIAGNIGDLGYEDIPDNANAILINARLEQIPGATALSEVYWSSTEYTESSVHTIQFKNGLIMQTSKGGSNALRPVLAF